MDIFGKTITQAEAGDSVMCFFRGVNPQNFYRGHTVCAINTIKPLTRFDGETIVLTPEEGGRQHGFNQRFKPQIYIGCGDSPINMIFPEDVDRVGPGDRLKLSYKLEKPLPLLKGDPFIIREGINTIAVGEITHVHERVIEPESGKGKEAKRRR